jgi:hypothetical protein
MFEFLSHNRSEVRSGRLIQGICDLAVVCNLRSQSLDRVLQEVAVTDAGASIAHSLVWGVVELAAPDEELRIRAVDRLIDFLGSAYDGWYAGVLVDGIVAPTLLRGNRYDVAERLSALLDTATSQWVENHLIRGMVRLLGSEYSQTDPEDASGPA